MTLSERYAKALLILATEQKNEDVVLADTKLVLKALSQSAELSSVISNPIFHVDKKIKIVGKLFKDKVSNLTLSFITLIIQKKRASKIREIFSAYESVFKKHKNIKDVYVKSAVELSADEKKLIQSKLKKKIDGELDFHFSVDESLIGGFVVNVDSMQLDMSIHGMLSKIRKNFEQTPITLN
ncbi:MAG: ATP synthase F1 subunit delta [Bacteroidia bacterium]|nr:ATP synthase F1 subunit delta [Bacteroidia bacterium]